MRPISTRIALRVRADAMAPGGMPAMRTAEILWMTRARRSASKADLTVGCE